MKTDTTRFKKTGVARAVITALCGTASMMVAQETLAQAQPSLQRVEITGSSIRRTDAETALPVQVITREEIQRTGVTSTEELLTTISAISSSGSLNSASGAGLSTYGFSSISLRGLGEERTLILVNGRRLAPFAPNGGAVNVNAIPLAAIERVEVLKDGASSLYGSDAMAGVVNFILRKDFKGVEATAGYGSPTDSGGGQNTNVSITAGFGGDDRWSAVVSASWEKDRALFGRDRPYSRTGNNPPFYVSGATGQGNIEGAVIPGGYPNDRVPGQFGNSPGTGFGNPAAVGAGGCESLRMYNAGTTSRGQQFCAYDPASDVGLLPDRDLFNLTGNVGFKLSPTMELFGDALYSKTTVRTTFQPSPLRRSFAVPSNTRLIAEGVDPSLIVYPSNPNYPTAYLTQYAPTLLGQPIAVTSRVFQFGGRQSTDDAEQTRFVGGLRGNLGKHEYEVALSSNESKVAGSVTGGYFSVTDYNRIINASDWNPWAPGGVQTGALADQLQAAEYRGPTLSATNKVEALDGILRGDLMQFGSGTVQYALGAQHRREHLVATPAPALETGDIAGLGGATPPVDRSRRVSSIFGEVNVPVTRQLELNGSVRHDRYNDVGSTTNYKANVRFQPMSTVLLRASVGTGFRAPTLYDLWQPQTVGTSVQFDDPATGQTDLQVPELTGGNPNLKPETSKQYSVGFVLSPANNISFGLDWFRYRIEDILATPTTQEVVSRYRAGDPAYAGSVDVAANNDIELVRSVIGNFGTANVSGFDLFASYRANLGPGRLDLGINGTYMSKFDQSSTGGPSVGKVGTLVDADGNPVPTTNGNDGGVILRWKHSLSASYSWNSWVFTLTQRHHNGYRAGNDLNNDPTFVPSQQFYDMNVIYRGVRNLSLQLGVKNMFDKQPAVFVPTSNQFQSGYDISQYDPRGRFVYVKATYLFK